MHITAPVLKQNTPIARFGTVLLSVSEQVTFLFSRLLTPEIFKTLQFISPKDFSQG